MFDSYACTVLHICLTHWHLVLMYLHLFVAARPNALVPCGFMLCACQQGIALCSSYTYVCAAPYSADLLSLGNIWAVDKREEYLHCSVLNCVPRLCTVMCTQTWACLADCSWVRFELLLFFKKYGQFTCVTVKIVLYTSSLVVVSLLVSSNAETTTTI